MCREFRGVRYHITVKNPDHVEKGTISMVIDNVPVKGNKIPLSAVGKDVYVEAVMGK